MDVDARYKKHASGKGAKYTRANRPVGIVAKQAYPDRSSASKAEFALKKMPRHRKPLFFVACGAA